MPGSIHVFGIRHHGPGSARVLVRALDTLNPSIVLIEGPPEAASDVIAFASDPQMTPPVALLVYDVETPTRAVYYPFAVFSPEWQAMRWALEKRAPARFIDLPESLRQRKDRAGQLDLLEAEAPQEPQESQGENGPSLAEGAQQSQEAQKEPALRDPLEALARAAGFSDGEAWWGRLIEERHAEDDPLGLFVAIHDAMASVRGELGAAAIDPGEPTREAYMRRSIRAAIKEGHERIAVVCGAWHAPELTSEGLQRHTIKKDDELIKRLVKRKTTATWIPWTYDLLSADSGYGAGVTSPGWYDHLWTYRDRLVERWMARVARLLREEDLDASPANVIESVRLAESLATIRGHRSAGLEELGDATLSVLCHGNAMPLRIIERKLIVGQRLGAVPDGVPMVPLQRDLTAQQKSLRLKVTADETVLDLDQRKENDRARSRLLHRLRILGIEWGELQEDQRQTFSTFHEIWTLQWQPAFAVKVIHAAQWGNTVAAAAAAAVTDRASKAEDLGELAELLDDVMLADLPGAVEALLVRVQSMAAVATDLAHLMSALPRLARVLRYGNVRGTDAALVEPVVEGLLTRITVGVLPASASLDDDAASAMRDRIDGVNGALATVNRPEWSSLWLDALGKLGDADIHGLVAGRAWRLRLDAGAAEAEAAADRLGLSLSRGADPSTASAWLEGFLSGSGMLLVHDERLLRIIDEWLMQLSREAFEQIAPIVRRTFSTYETAERRQIGGRLKRTGPAGASRAASETEADDYSPDRGALVEPVLQLILGERLKGLPR
jgi:hypothetical protein